MSPLWRDEVGAFLGPGRVALTRTCRGLRPRRIAEWGTTVRMSETNAWSAAFAALDAELAESRWQDANLRVAISDYWARYRIVPWSEKLRSETERFDHARSVMVNTYGNLVDDWSLALSGNHPGSPRVVSALPTRLLEELRARIPAHRLNLISIQPQLIAAYNTRRHQLPVSGGWFVSIDDDSLAALHWSEAGWDQVHSVRISDSWDAELRRLRAFGGLTGRIDTDRIFIDAPHRADPRLDGLDSGEVDSATPGMLASGRGIHA